MSLLIALRKSPHLEALCEGILACGDRFTSSNNGGADYFLAWGWPQAQDVVRENGEQITPRVICVDAHPFALAPGARCGSRILQLGNWGALADYPQTIDSSYVENTPPRSKRRGHTLVIGQVYTAEQKRLGLVDVWHTGGYEQWLTDALSKPNTVYRKHPRVWMVENEGEKQPSLEDDLKGCAQVVTWNSTAGIHAKMLGYPATAAESHGWAHMRLDHLASLRQSPQALRSGSGWAEYRAWLAQRPKAPA